MIENFFIIVLFVGTCSATPWHECHNSYEDDLQHNSTNTQLKQRVFDKPKCDKSGDPFLGDTNWFGIMAGIASMNPELGFIAGMMTIFSSIDFGGNSDGDFTPELQACVGFMIGKAMEDADFDKSVDRMGQIQEYKTFFLERLDNLPSSHDVETVITYAEKDIDHITTNLDMIVVDYTYGGTSDDPAITYDRHHERFLDLLLEALTVQLGAQTLLLGALSNLNNYDRDKLCEHATQIKINLNGALGIYFQEESSEFHLKSILDRSPIADWPNQLKWKHVFGPRNSVLLRDDYRGFDIEACCYDDFEEEPHCCRTYQYDYPTQEPCHKHNHWIWDCDTSYLHPDDSVPNCKYGIDYAKKQRGQRYTSIDDGKKMVENLKKAVENIEHDHKC